ncbi:DUF2076 domain-containing protein [Nocardia concava]|uniref:DUF2076 domain-containing protein n=1 Tax=Nocardia concava TaxID=257281 RepID=UPI0002EC2E48|nr:DUF2076 family protein [Nocardia concava]
MDHTEQQLIGNLAERIRAAQPVTKDPQAAEAVQRLIASQPDALYVLAQAVILQEQALQQAQAQLAELNGRLAQQQAPADRPGGGFLANLFGKPSQQGPGNAAVPAGAAGGFGGAPGQAGGFGGAAPEQSGRRGPGGFLATAGSAAVGVAGGALLFQGISNAFSGHNTHTASADAHGTNDTHEQSGFGGFDDDSW